MSLLFDLVVREFRGPNSFIVGENLMSLYPHVVFFVCVNVGE